MTCRSLPQPQRAVRSSLGIAGPGHHDADAASVRTNIPIAQSTGLFYYEVTVVSKGRHGYIGELVVVLSSAHYAVLWACLAKATLPLR